MRRVAIEDRVLTAEVPAGTISSGLPARRRSTR
jgi:hypothetical protein